MFKALANDAGRNFALLQTQLRDDFASKFQGLLAPTVGAARTGQSAIRNLSLEFDRFNDTLTATYETGIRFGDQFVPVAKIREASGAVGQLIAQFEQLSIAEKEVAAQQSARKGYAAQLLQLEQQRSALAVQALSYARPTRTNPAGGQDYQLLQLAKAERDRARQEYIGRRDAERAIGVSPSNLTQVARAEYLNANAQYNGLLQIRKGIMNEIKRIETEILSVQNKEAGAIDAGNIALQRRAGIEKEIQRLRAVPAPLPVDVRNALGQSKELTRELERAGLGRRVDGSALTKTNVAETLRSQNFSVRQVEDLQHGVRRISGEFTDATGVVKQFTAEVDKNGKLMTRFGGVLSGTGGFLRQISRDFQKVIEWTIATTVVFGALRYATEQLQNLRELDTALQKFSITAQLTPREATEEFSRLADIAFATATPLNELISSADDVALATKKAGQSTAEWTKQIEDLVYAVGIFTNLTGVDTVTATDILTASMKQLNLETTEITGLISKITAVSGGQSQAIADVTKTVSVMAETARVAGLDIDQLVAASLVLSQVTSKTPAEVATAFKNLVGSLGSPGSIKRLSDFNISLRDQQGELRNIIDVYGEIQAKIRQGIIPQSEVQSVVRAISGGPRRAPDAAALLNALEAISAAQIKSASATNEAYLANARAIDTTQAKIIQLQSLIDKTTFEKFGSGLRSATGFLLDQVTELVKVLNEFSGAVEQGARLLGFLLLIRAGIPLFGKFASGIGGVVNLLKTLALTAVEAAVSFKVLNAATLATQRGSLFGAVGGSASSVGLIAALKAASKSAAVGAAAGGLAAQVTGGDALGGALQGLGFGLIGGAPHPLLKALGGILLLLGTVKQSFHEVNTEATNTAEIANKIVNEFSKFKDVQTSLQGVTQQQQALEQSIARLQSTPNRTAEQTSELADAQSQYTKNLVEQINLQQEQVTTAETLLDLLDTQPSEASKTASQILKDSVQGVRVSTKELQDAIKEYMLIVLRQTNPDLQEVPALRRPQNNTSISGTRQRNPWEGLLTDLTQLEQDPTLVVQAFTDDLKALNPTVAITEQNMDLLEKAIRSWVGLGPEVKDMLLGIIENMRKAADETYSTANAFKTFELFLDGLAIAGHKGAVEGEKLTNFLKDYSDALDLANKNNQYGAGTEEFVENEKAKIRELLAAFQDNPTLNNPATQDVLKAMLQGFLSLLPETAKGFVSLDALTQEYFDTLLGGAEKSKPAIEELSEELIETAESLDQLIASLGSGIAGDIAELRADLQGGIINQSEYDKEVGVLREMLSLVTNVATAFKDSITDIAGFNENLQASLVSFAGIPGLEDAATLSTEDFIQRLFTLADTYNLNKQQLGELATALLNFRSLLESLSKLNIQIPVGLKLDVSTIKAQIQKVLAFVNSVPRDESYANPELINLYNLLAALEKAGDPLQTITNQVSKIYASGSGTTRTGSSGSTTSAPTIDLGTLDIPEEIAEAINKDALIQQAIINARALQNTLPGENQEASNDIVALLEGTKNLLEVRGVKEEYLRKALEELADIERKRLEFETKADQIRRIRVGAGDFSAIANVPLNSQTGVSVGSPNQINVTLSVNGTILTPAQLSQFADLVGAALKRQIASG